MVLLLSKKPRRDITYYDVPGKVLEFTRWGFRKYGHPIKVIEGSDYRDKLEGVYDTIICLDVLEHPVNPLDHLKRLRKQLSDKGKLYVNAAFVPKKEDEEIHRYSERPLKDLLREAGFKKSQIVIYL